MTDSDKLKAQSSKLKVMNILGIDVGASGIKGAVVDITTGEYVQKRIRLEMPAASTPENAGNVIAELARQFNYSGVIGVGFPAVIKNGKTLTAANLDKSWIGCPIETFLGGKTGQKVIALNDADAAGLAEMRFGEGKGVKGTVILITIGTGLGTAVFTDGHLLRNTELGHIFLQSGIDAEKMASDSARQREDLTWRKWGKRFNEYLEQIEMLLQPQLILLGGGASKQFSEYKERITIQTPVIPAKLLNNAGIIGAAIYAHESQ